MATTKSGIVRPIDQGTVHRICSGQVVLTLAVAVKELVENSLDSKATQIEVRLKEYGSELVEVSDNGSGIRPDDFEALCLKHHTSKIQEFEDLLSVQTFGFRGEALSSLCALSRLSVTTCSKDQDLGWKLEFDHHGKLARQVRYSRQPGTTVTLEQLFSTLPVRHKEFTRNLKREFAKMTDMLTGYCLISSGTRITCTNMTAGGKRNTVLSTRGGANLRDNFTLVFGMKSWQGMLEMETVAPDEDLLLEFGLNAAVLQRTETPSFRLEGFVSSCAHGVGRSCADRQFYFINGRPCDPTKVSKLVNEVYHTHNRHQYPIVVLNITTGTAQVDVNVTPDKRQLMVTNEKFLLATVKASLNRVYANIANTYALQNTSLLSAPMPTHSVAKSEDGDGDDGDDGVEPAPTPKRRSLAAFVAAGADSPTRLRTLPSPSQQLKRKSLAAPSPAAKQTRLEGYSSGIKADRQPVTVAELPKKAPVSAQNSVWTPWAPAWNLSRTLNLAAAFDTATLRRRLGSNAESTPTAASRRFMARIGADDAATAEAELGRHIRQSDFDKMEVVGQFNLGFIIARLAGDLFIVDQHAADEKFNFETLQRCTRLKPQKLVCAKPLHLTAANELLVSDHLDVFRRNGFDFLIKPEEEATRRVWLTSVPTSGNWSFGPSDVDELLFILQDAPVYRDQEGVETELHERLMAQYRPSRVRAMFASRACRKAIMVGTALTGQQMRRLVAQLGHLQQPWNCPHGRPTMRHLINLDQLNNS